MRLVELDPKWLMIDGRRVGFVFRCPLEPANAKRLQSCFFEPTPRKVQWDLFEAIGSGEDCVIVQGCRPDFAWSCASGPVADASFDTISITPSIDGSPGGNWHGHITNGEIVGGL